MTPNEALQYISQALSDYGRTLPPSAAMPFQQVAQDAVTTLARVIDPPPKESAEVTPPLHAVRE